MQNSRSMGRCIHHTPSKAVLGGELVVLTGMVVSLFLNAIMDLLSTLSPLYAQQISLWTLGSFSSKEWSQVAVLAPVSATMSL